jgi:hypothetical protein
MTVTNKWYSYPRVAAIWINVHPTGENPTNTSHAFHAQSAYGQTIRISRSQRIATFHKVINRFVQIHCLREATTWRSSDPWVRTQLLSHNSQWGSGEKTSFCWQPVTRFTGPISSACDRYVQYLLTGVNPSVLNRHRRGLQPWRRHSLTFSIDGLPFSPMGPARSPVYPRI